MAMKTPGVYIVEKNAFPNSVVEVATAVPAFIGYTKKAINGGTSLAGKPWRIASMAEYERYFGGPPVPVFTVKVSGTVDANAVTALTTTAATADGEVATRTGAVTAAQNAVDGSPQVTGLKAAQAAMDAAGKDTAAIAAAQPALDAALKVEPDAALAKTLLEAQQDLAKARIAATKAKLAVPAAQAMAAAPALPDMKAARGQALGFKLGGKDYLLSRAAGKAGGRFLMYQAMRHFFQNGGGPCYVVSVGDYSDDIAAGDEVKGLVGGITPLLKEQEPTMVLVPDAVLLSKADCATVQAAALKHCGLDMRNRFAILDVWGGEQDRQFENGSCIDDFRETIGINHLKYAAAYYPWLHTSLVQISEVDYGAVFNIDEFAGLLGDELGLADLDATEKRPQDLIKLMGELPTTDVQWKTRLTAAIDAGQGSTIEKNAARKALDDADGLATAIRPYRELMHKSLVVVSTLYPKVMEEIQRLMNVMPPSAAMAGLYTMVDNTRGVWKAPANYSVAGVIKPAVEISHGDQEDLNVHTAGKSINAIRSFIGEGALVWGARTLDGNSLDWRYINVRRTMIMLEESCRLAAKAMVFEPNVGNTWVTIKSMISNFLTGIWKRGGLAGAVPDDAFSVQVGLGETMTPEDILEGILRVTVLVAISRPAEFIEITFQQQMQKS